MSRCHTCDIPASACFIPEADAGFTTHPFMLPGHSRLSFGHITPVSERSHAGDIPLASSDAASRSLEELDLHT